MGKMQSNHHFIHLNYAECSWRRSSVGKNTLLLYLVCDHNQFAIAQKIQHVIHPLNAVAGLRVPSATTTFRTMGSLRPSPPPWSLGSVQWLQSFLTTSRPEFLRQTTVDEMSRHNMPYDQLVMGLPHCKRVVVNDFANSNSFPCAEAINIPRNQNNLSEYL